ncbi:MAG: CotH kinase family protein [Ignavibacteriales bacterium]|nr:CotH kinase family protein [Ignavibacteriales bacterium]
MSSNISALADEDGDYPDWIEIYNPTDSIISLSGYSLSDDVKLPNKWIFPNINLNPNNYLVIFASGKNRTGEYLHTNFKIKSSGENVRLRDSFGHVVDSIKSIPIPSDHSLGRSKDDQSLWLFFDVPTPSTANNSTGFLASAETPNLSIQSGFYSGTISVNIFSNDEQAQIYYTEDGSEPNLNSNLFTNDLTINSTTVIKAKSFGDDLLPSATATRSFFINENSTLPVVSISTDPKNFWDDEIGIYTVGTNGIIGYGSTEPKNYNQPWERPANLEFFETDGSIQINMGVGIKIHGGWSRQNPQKSLEIFSESHYGGKSIPYKLFPNREFKEYNAFLLRNSGQDNQSTFFRDAMMQSLVEGLDMETEAYRPALVYLNGEYWGIHNIRERMNKHYIAQHKGVDSDAIDVLRNRRTVVKGSADHYDAMYSFIQNNDMSLAENYSYIEAQMDIDNYISYIIAEMYFVNIDWFPNNMKFWRPQTSDGKWRWMLKDTDWGFGLYSPLQVMVNMFGVITSPDNHPSVVFNGLIQNSDFKTNLLIGLLIFQIQDFILIQLFLKSRE